MMQEEMLEALAIFGQKRDYSDNSLQRSKLTTWTSSNKEQEGKSIFNSIFQAWCMKQSNGEHFPSNSKVLQNPKRWPIGELGWWWLHIEANKGLPLTLFLWALDWTRQGRACLGCRVEGHWGEPTMYRESSAYACFGLASSCSLKALCSLSSS